MVDAVAERGIATGRNLLFEFPDGTSMDEASVTAQRVFEHKYAGQLDSRIVDLGHGVFLFAGDIVSERPQLPDDDLGDHDRQTRVLMDTHLVMVEETVPQDLIPD